MSITRVTVGLVLSGLMSAATAAMLAPAAIAAPDQPYDVQDNYIAMPCYGLSPNIIDLPYNGGVHLQTRRSAPGWLTILADSKSIFGYTSDATIDWHNLDNGRSGSISMTYQHSLGDASGYAIRDIDSGQGRLRVTVTAVNRGSRTLPAPTCSGEAII